MTFRAIGAATLPPVPAFSTNTATTTRGSSAGAKAVNQACGSPWATSAVPVLPATLTPLRAAWVPVPLSTTFTMSDRRVSAVSAEIGLSQTLGSVSSSTWP